jgi:hypothetical protein
MPLPWRRSVLALSLLAATCTPAQIEREKLADGSWRLACRLPMDSCVLELEKICPDKRYKVLRGESRLEYIGVDPGPTEIRKSELTFVCGAPKSAASSEASAAPAPPSRPPCVPGSTQACTGVGACAGGQVCRPDGAGFGPCECGTASPTGADAGAEATAPDAGTSPAR